MRGRGLIIGHMNESESPTSLGRFLTISDTADVLNISASQAYALVRSGELPAIKIGGHGHWRIERDVLESYIEAMYEEARRLSLWNQSDYANLPELAVGSPQPGRTVLARTVLARTNQSRTNQSRTDQSRTKTI